MNATIYAYLMRSVRVSPEKRSSEGLIFSLQNAKWAALSRSEYHR